MEVIPFFGLDQWLINLTWEETLAPCPWSFCMKKFCMDHQDFMPNIET